MTTPPQLSTRLVNTQFTLNKHLGNNNTIAENGAKNINKTITCRSYKSPANNDK